MHFGQKQKHVQLQLVDWRDTATATATSNAISQYRNRMQSFVNECECRYSSQKSKLSFENEVAHRGIHAGYLKLCQVFRSAAHKRMNHSADEMLHNFPEAERSLELFAWHILCEHLLNIFSCAVNKWLN